MARLDDTSARDRDETRRLLYMALFVAKTKKYNLAGTLVNALRHHQGINPPDLEAQVLDFIEGRSEDETWMRDQIQRLIKDLSE